MKKTLAIGRKARRPIPDRPAKKTKPGAKAGTKGGADVRARSQAKSEPKSRAKSGARSQAKFETKFETRSETRSETKRLRLSPQARSDLILRGAIRFFAERGFEGQTRDLAKQLGISAGLLFRYFPTKDALIDRIYETLFEGRWKPEWDEILGNRSRDLRERLIAFYLDYSQMLHDYEWGRIYLYSGLGGAGIAQRFARMVTDRVYARVVGELRHAFGRPDLAAEPMSEPEIELMWSLHGSIFYIGLRKWVYNVGGPSDIPGTVTEIVERFHVNAGALMRQLAAERKSPDRKSRARMAVPKARDETAMRDRKREKEKQAPAADRRTPLAQRPR